MADPPVLLPEGLPVPLRLPSCPVPLPRAVPLPIPPLLALAQDELLCEAEVVGCNALPLC